MAVLVFVILFTILTFAIGFLIGDCYRSKESKFIKILAWISSLFGIMILIASLFSYKEIIIQNTLFDRYQIEQKTTTTITYNIISKYE